MGCNVLVKLLVLCAHNVQGDIDAITHSACFHLAKGNLALHMSVQKKTLFQP